MVLGRLANLRESMIPGSYGASPGGRGRLGWDGNKLVGRGERNTWLEAGVCVCVCVCGSDSKSGW